MGLPAWAETTADGQKFSDRGGAVSSGIFYNLLATVFQILGSLVSVILFARLLSAEDFGVYGMILPFMMVLVVLADGGSVYSTLRRPRITDRALSFAFWYCSVIGVALVLLLWLATPLIARIMDEPRLLDVGFVIAIALLFSSLASQYQALTMRCFRNDLRTWGIVVSVTVSLIIGLGMALAGAGYWALVAVFVSRAAVMTGMLVWLTGWRPMRPAWHGDLISEIRSLALVELGARIVIDVMRGMDRVVVGILFSTVAVGYYALAYMLSVVPLLQLTSPLILVMMPYLTEQRGNPAAFFETLHRMIGAIAYLLVPTGLFLALFADDILPVVIGADKAAVADIFPMLVIAAVATVGTGFLSIALQSMDRPDLTRRYSFYVLVLTTVAILLAMPFGSPEAIAWGVMVSYLLGLAHRFIVIMRYFDRSSWAELRTHLPLLLVSVAIPLGIKAVVMMFDPFTGFGLVLGLLPLLGMFGVIYLGLGWVFFGKDIRAVLEQRRQRRAPTTAMAGE